MTRDMTDSDRSCRIVTRDMTDSDRSCRIVTPTLSSTEEAVHGDYYGLGTSLQVLTPKCFFVLLADFPCTNNERFVHF